MCNLRWLWYLPLFVLAPAAFAAADTLDRTVLPVPEPKRPMYTELDARKIKAPLHFEVKAPKGAPNVVIVLLPRPATQFGCRHQAARPGQGDDPLRLCL
jgi:hypothetical protein